MERFRTWTIVLRVIGYILAITNALFIALGTLGFIGSFSSTVSAKDKEVLSAGNFAIFIFILLLPTVLGIVLIILSNKRMKRWKRYKEYLGLIKAHIIDITNIAANTNHSPQEVEKEIREMITSGFFENSEAAIINGQVIVVSNQTYR